MTTFTLGGCGNADEKEILVVFVRQDGQRRLGNPSTTRESEFDSMKAR